MTSDSGLRVDGDCDSAPAPARGGGASTDDESFLDEVLDRAVAMLQRGERADAGDLAAERPHLASRVVEQVRLAESISPRPRSDLPEVGGYTIIAEAGRGGMGTVYLARQESLGGRPVALKVLSGSSSLSPAARRRFKQESEVVARLCHPNIIGVHDVPHAEPVPAYAMEWVEGRSLAAVIERARAVACGAGGDSRAGISMEQVREFVAGGEGVPREPGGPGGVLEAETYTVFVCRVGLAMARALAAVHRAGLLHRDVKPSNILVRCDGVPLLTDFGLAEDAEATLATQAGQFLGTPAYASPEQLRGERLDARGDVYALGATLYHALALRVPFDGSGTGAILRQIESGRLRPVRSLDRRVPRDLETIVTKAMEAEASRRYGTAEEMAEDLERLLSLRPVRARRAGIVGRGLKLARRNGALAAGLLVGGVVAIAASLAVVLYAYVLPGWAARDLSAARSALINPVFQELAYLTRTELDLPGFIPSQYTGASERCTEALDIYDRVKLELTGRSNGLVDLERETVVAALRVVSRGGADRSGSHLLQVRAPFTAGVARMWLDSPGGPIDEAGMARASKDDLRCLGLLCYLCLRAEDAIGAWERSGLDTAEPIDPVINAAMGQSYLAFGDFQRATLRLGRAHIVMPDNLPICRALALSALNSGETELASRIVREAEQRGHISGPKDPFLQVKAQTLAKRGLLGDYEAASGIYDRLLPITSAPRPFLDYARLRLEKGDILGAMEVYHRLALSRPNDPTSLGQFVRGVRRCWARLDDEVRRNLVRTSDVYRAVWEMHERVLSEHSLESLRDPSSKPGDEQIEDLPALEPARVGGR